MSSVSDSCQPSGGGASRPLVTGVFGGSFNPVHIGHTRLASWLVEKGVCSRVLLMVSPQNPLKTDSRLAPFEDRFAMASLAAAGITGVEASDFEATLSLPSYTCRTLRALAESMPDADIRLIIGADNWLIFDRWRDSEEIINRFHPIIYPRPGYEVDQASLPPGVIYLPDAPLTDISSTEIRALLDPTRNNNGIRAQHYLHPDVLEYIRQRSLYS